MRDDVGVTDVAVTGTPVRRRRWVRRAGIACVLAGLVLLGYVGWQLWVTNIISERQQRETVEQLEREWQSDSAEPDAAPALGDAIALIRIPRFGSSYVMPVLEGVDDDSLSRGFAHFSGSAGPGEEGNFALAAHRVTHGEPLRDMPDLQPGDEVIVETRDTIHTYEIDTDPEDLVVDFEDVWVIDERPVNPDPNGVQPADAPRLITLTTCAELFHTDDRMVAFGHLVTSTPKQG